MGGGDARFPRPSDVRGRDGMRGAAPVRGCSLPAERAARFRGLSLKPGTLAVLCAFFLERVARRVHVHVAHVGCNGWCAGSLT